MSEIRPAELVLDDEIRSVESMARILGEEFDGYTASRAAQALELLRQWFECRLATGGESRPIRCIGADFRRIGNRQGIVRPRPALQ